MEDIISEVGYYRLGLKMLLRLCGKVSSGSKTSNEADYFHGKNTLIR